MMYSQGSTDTVPTLDLDSEDSSGVEAHLEAINTAIAEISSLSQQFLSVRDEFISSYEAARGELAALYMADRKVIDNARPFYVARDNAYKAKYEHRKCTAKYKRACEDLDESKDNARRAEEALMVPSGGEGITDPDLLTNLNKANERVSHLGRYRDEVDEEQQRSMTALSLADEHLANLAQQLSKPVIKASSYFDTRDKLQRQLDAKYYRLWELNRRVHDAKQKHKEMFPDFSAISVGVTKVTCAHDMSFDLSNFEEVPDASSLENSYNEDSSVKLKYAHSLDKTSLHSNSSDVNISHMTKTAHALSPEEFGDLSISDPEETSSHELYTDYGVSFQMNV